MKIPIIYWLLEYTLKFFNLWSDEVTNISGLLFLISNVILTIPFQCWDCIRLESSILLIDSACLIIDELCTHTKVCLMLINRRQIINLLREIEDDYTKRKVSDKWLKLEYEAHLFSKVDNTWYLSAIVLYVLQFLFQYIKLPVEQRELLLKVYYPFDYKSSPIYEIICFLQIFQIFSIAIFHSMSESLLAALILHASGHIHLLIDQIEILSDYCSKNLSTNTKKKENMQITLSKVWKKHLKVLSLFSKIESIFMYVSLFQVFLSTLTICASEFIILTALQKNDMLHVLKFGGMIMALTCQAFSYCFAGQYIINKNDTIIYSIYNTVWYNMEIKDIKSLLFIIKRMQSPLVITAGKLFILSTESFLMIIKTSFSYFSVLRVAYS